MFKYFKEFPTIEYDINGDKTTDLLTNILKRVRVRNSVKDNISLYTQLDVTDRDQPEVLADKFYGDSGLHWIILIMNGIIDPFYDWILSTQDLQLFITDKYGIGNENATHHWELTDGNYEVPSTFPNASVVTNSEFETFENEKKRRIKILDAKYVNNFITEYRNLITI